MSLLPLVLVACVSMESSGDVFAPARAKPVADVAAEAFPETPTFVLTSEQMAGGKAAPADAARSLAAAVGVDPSQLEDAEEAVATPLAAASTVVMAPPPVGLPTSAWPVRLLSTIAQAQPPRAVIGLPSGEERVVSPGSILAEQGLVVMSVTQDRVQVAKIEPAGDHARIETIELSAQYP